MWYYSFRMEFLHIFFQIFFIWKSHILKKSHVFSIDFCHIFIQAFGFLLSTGSLGQTAFTAFATSVAPLEIGPIAGWQFALTLGAYLCVRQGQIWHRKWWKNKEMSLIYETEAWMIDG